MGDRLLRDYLDQLAEFLTEAPLEVWDNRARRRVVVVEDRWRAAMLLWPFQRGRRGRVTARFAWPGSSQGGWVISA